MRADVNVFGIASACGQRENGKLPGFPFFFSKGITLNRRLGTKKANVAARYFSSAPARLRGAMRAWERAFHAEYAAGRSEATMTAAMT